MELFRSYLNNRQQCIYVGTRKSSLSTLMYGILQGFVLGPILFSLYIYDLLLYTTALCELFADETSMHNYHADLTILHASLQNCRWIKTASCTAYSWMLHVLDSGVEIVRRECFAVSGSSSLQLLWRTEPPHWCEVSFPVQLWAFFVNHHSLQLVSSLFTHIQWLAFSTVSWRAFVKMFLFFVQSPATLIHFVMLVAMYPLQPTSTGKCIAFHPSSSHSPTRAS